MFVINKTRIWLVFTCLLISTMGFQIAKPSKQKAQETVALPVNNKTIIIDAGHGR